MSPTACCLSGSAVAGMDESDPLSQIHDHIREHGGAPTAAAAKEAPGGARWLALESNPEVFNTFASRVGLPAGWEFVDVLGLDDELLCMVPQPCAALVLLFPCTEAMYKKRRDQDADLKEGRRAVDEPLFFVKQLRDFGNACGTIACVHALGNVRTTVGMPDSAPLAEFAKQAAGLDPEERGKALLRADAFKSLSDQAATDSAAQTACPSREARVDHHFVAFVQSPGGRLVELDGTKRGAVDHGVTTSDSFLSDAAAVIRKEFIAVEPDYMGFVVMALSQTTGG